MACQLFFYADYFGMESEADLYLDKAPLKEAIDQLIKTNKQYIYNSTSVEYLNHINTERASKYFSSEDGVDATRCLIYQIDGSNTPAGLAHQPKGRKDVLVAINFSDDTLKILQEINLSNVEANDIFTDILGFSNSPKMKITEDSVLQIPNAVYIELPPKAYSIWVQGNESPVLAEFIEFSAEAYEDFIEISWEIPSEKSC